LPNLPTILTLARILLVPVMMVLALPQFPSGRIWAAIIFIVACITDFLDGYIARRRKEVTVFGSVIDPVADKLLVSAALLSLMDLGMVAGWMVMIIIGREFAVSGLRVVLASEDYVMPASNWGKAKTVSQMIAIVALFFQLSFAKYLFWISVVLTVISGVEYFVRARDILFKR
jgi:CDP-diacylglycerol--glycerol-3-phosphate 3-phosphatidyltransferase